MRRRPGLIRPDRARPDLARPGLITVPLVALVLLATGCAKDAVTKDQFLDHAVEFSTAAKTPAQKESIRKLFGCVWPEISKDEQLLSDFMDASEANPALSAAVSKLMLPCVTAQAKEMATTTTIPPG